MVVSMKKKKKKTKAKPAMSYKSVETFQTRNISYSWAVVYIEPS